MDDKYCVVTGATSGIGKETARGLIAAGRRVLFVCRDRARGEATLADLRGERSQADVQMFVADLSVLADVRRVAGEIHQHLPRLDVLVNNAGTHDLRAAVSADGFDRMIATNHLGPFLLTHLLVDLLERGAPSRIVMVASESHRSVVRIDPRTFADPGTYGPIGSLAVYARSKLLNVLTTQEIARRWAAQGISANAFCPGLVSSGLVRNIPMGTALFSLARLTPAVRSPKQGSEHALRLANDPSFTGRSGGFYSTTAGAVLLPPALHRFRPGLQREVWERSEELVGIR
ncbi:Rhamnolipids biosynthesis 3-oxoacyl-[acyl-carrier-protein] reductase [Streptomyces hundungensis]|uniref:Rhamnolipids biosynthesis 3-oxoacyl-[acyl-carrier-protein] reductase n=1 Tax=Streptomyces hundungensis TaxID=1077946 RepID=A0A387H491_9ACTN|nr:SDR family NAD(P)-dependent oxidoreductase [Streptomyces hundungensis]AYG77999.1 Rhamnolipids biosynthesis 3-oxoacyl-[acyl-carrier-protein] reductase [Streptomyces hundungensis]